MCSRHCKISENISDTITDFGRAVSAIGEKDEPNYSCLLEIVKVSYIKLNLLFSFRNLLGMHNSTIPTIGKMILSMFMLNKILIAIFQT